MGVFSTGSCTAYCGTGFSMINTPATGAVLASSATNTINLGQINCLSLIGKKVGSIQVHAFSEINTCDYLKIVFSQNPIDSYWIVTGYEYISSDTLMIHIVLDGFLTCGGTTGITSLTGYVKRHTVTDDTYGKYIQIDPMLIPSQNLIFRTLEEFNMLSGSTYPLKEDCFNIILSNANLIDLVCSADVDLARTYGDISNGEAITVPELPQIPSTWYTDVRMGTKVYTLPCMLAYNYDDAGGYIKNAVARLHALGMDNAIIACYGLPKRYFSMLYESVTRTIGGTSVTISDALIGQISDKSNLQTPDPNFNISTNVQFLYKNVNNKKALYNGYDTVKMISNCSGTSIDFDILDLYHTGETNVTVKVYADGRAHGKPTFRPKYFHDKLNTETSPIAYVEGLEWQNVPLQFTYSPGWYKELQRLKASEKVSAQNLYYQQQYDKAWGIPNMALDAVGMGLNAQSSYLGSYSAKAGGYTADPAMLGGKMALGVTKSVLGYAQTLGQQELDASVWARNRNLERKNFEVDSKFSIPDIAFPVSENIRDFYGNGLIVSFLTPTDSDIERFDKILTMYGYYDCGAMLTTGDMTAGLNFSYIEATGVQIQSSVAVDRNIVEMAEAQIEGGIRIWKHKPNFSEYNQGNR